MIELAGPDPDRRRTASTIIDDINTQIQRYLRVHLVTAIVVGLATWTVVGRCVQHAATGILAGVFNSIPYFGPVVVSGGLFLVGMVQSGGVMHALQVSGSRFRITSLEGWLLTPALMGKAERMSALAVFIGVLLDVDLGSVGTVLACRCSSSSSPSPITWSRFGPWGRLTAP